MQLQATARRLLAAMLAFAFGLLGASPASAVTPPSTYDTATYTYDSPSSLSMQDVAAPSPRGSPAGPLGASWEGSVSLARCGVAAETGGEAASAARGGVYSLRDGAGNVVRTGRSNDLAAREVAHANDSVLGDFTFHAEYRADVYAEQRGLEQALYDANPGAMSINGGFNMIRGISLSNPRLGEYTQAAEDFFARLGG